MFVLRFMKLLNNVANQNRTWDKLFCIANLGLYKGCLGKKRVALTPQARIQTLLPPAGLQAWARSKVSWLHNQRGTPKPKLLKKRNFPTEAETPQDRKERKKKKNSQGKRGPCLKVSTRTPFVSSPVRQPNPISQDKKTTTMKKNPCHPLTCPSGKPGKIPLCKQKH